MAAPTLGTWVHASTTSSGTKTWTLTQGTAIAMVGAMMRSSTWNDSRGTWGGLNVGAAQGASGTQAPAGYIEHLIDLTGKSGDGRSATSSYGDDRYWWEVPVSHESASELVLVDSAKSYSDNFTGYREALLDPGDNDCIAVFIGSAERSDSWRVGALADEAGLVTVTEHYAAAYSGRYTRIWSAPLLASDGETNFRSYFNGYCSFLLATLLGVPAGGASRSQAMMLG